MGKFLPLMVKTVNGRQRPREEGRTGPLSSCPPRSNLSHGQASVQFMAQPQELLRRGRQADELCPPVLWLTDLRTEKTSGQNKFVKIFHSNTAFGQK